MFLAEVQAQAQTPVALSGQGQECGGLRSRIQIDPEMAEVELRQPVVFRGSVQKDVARRKTFGQCSAQFEFADHFDGPALLFPPLPKGRQGLGFGGQPGTDRQPVQVLVQCLQRLLDGFDRKQEERCGRAWEEILYQAEPETPGGRRHRRGLVLRTGLVDGMRWDHRGAQGAARARR